MLKINDIYYDLDILDILNELKSQLELNDVHLFNQIKPLPENIMVSCPFHKNGQERKASCGIRRSDGLLHCFTCGETATLEETISRCFGHDDIGQFGSKWLRNNFLSNMLEDRNVKINISRNKQTIKQQFVSNEELESYRFYHPYMYKRKLTDDVINKFDIGYDEKTNCITFPVRDINGNCLFIARRNVDYKYFNYPTNIEKPVYGIYELKKYTNNLDEIIVCESMLNALTCWVYGRPAVALNGTGTAYQYEQLKQLKYRKLILALDPDNAGRKGMQKLYNALKNYKLVSFLKGIPEHSDINDLSSSDFEKCYETFTL